MPPRDLNELFAFYHNYVKPLYSAIQVNNALPYEVLFELNATLDHVSRKWSYGLSDDEVVHKAYAHLKRCCLDIFKLQVKRATDLYRELQKIDTSIIDNGRYENELVRLYSQIRAEATEARKQEGDHRHDDDDRVAAFDMWQPVFDKCVRLEKDFYEHPAVDWAKKKHRLVTRKTLFISILASVIASVLVGVFTSAWIKDTVHKIFVLMFKS